MDWPLIVALSVWLSVSILVAFDAPGNEGALVTACVSVGWPVLFIQSVCEWAFSEHRRRKSQKPRTF